MEAQRQKLMKISEKNHGQSNADTNRRRTTNRGPQATGTNTRSGRNTGGGRKLSATKHQSDARRARQGAPSGSQNSLPSVSQLDVVQLAGRSKVLLPDNAHDKQGQQRLKPDNKVRRSFFGLSRKNIVIKGLV